MSDKDPDMEQMRKQASGESLRPYPKPDRPAIETSDFRVAGAPGLRLTTAEREALESLGWEEGQPVPANIKELTDRIQVEAERENPVIPTVAEVVSVRDSEDEYLALPPLDVREKKPEPKSKLEPEPERKSESPTEIVMDLEFPETTKKPTTEPKATPASLVQRSPLPEAPESKKEEEEPDVEAQLKSLGFNDARCPHCNWILSLPTIPEPEDRDKQAFLHSILGQKPFTKQYELLGGNLLVTYRTLTTREMDQVYKQTAYDFERNPNWTIADFWERVNRYRIYLQIRYLRSTAGEITQDLPDGLSKTTNPAANSFWFGIDGQAGKLESPNPEDPRETVIPTIEEYFLEHIIRTESLHRAIGRICGKFNRLVAKLEAVIDNSDFWKRTDKPS